MCMFVDVCTRSNAMMLAPQKMLLVFVGAAHSTEEDAAIALTKPAGNVHGSLTRQLSTWCMTCVLHVVVACT